MTDDRTLTEWLHRDTPPPPRDLDFDDLARRLRRRQRHWMPLLAAAVVIAVATTAVAVWPSPRSTGPVAPSSSAVPSSPTAVVSAPTTTTPVSLAARPWGAAVVSRASLRDASLIGFGGSLYGITSYGTATVIERLDAQGRVLARSDAPAAGIAFLDDRLWTTQGFEGDRVHVCSHDPATLARRVCWSVPMPGDLGSREPVLATGNDLVYVGAGVTVAAVDPASGAIRRTYYLGETVTALTVSPDGRLYVGYGTEGSGTVVELDAGSGVVRRKLSGDVAVLDVAAGATGVFVSRADGGHVDSVYFISDSGERYLAQGGGGTDPDVGISSGVAWVGGTQRLVCADPASGRIRARTPIGATASFTGITAVGGRLYAIYYDGTQRALVVLHPPAACGLR